MTDDRCTLQGGKRFVVSHGVKVEPVVSASAPSQLPPRPGSRRRSSIPAAGGAGGAGGSPRQRGSVLAMPTDSQRPSSSSASVVSPTPPTDSARGQLRAASSASHTVSWSEQTANDSVLPPHQTRQRPASARPRLQQVFPYIFT
jgi:hypothetical protein